jgi:hypothetical protein
MIDQEIRAQAAGVADWHANTENDLERQKGS